MKKISERIQRVFAVAKSEEKQECQNMGRAQKLLNVEANRLQELRAYRHSYAGKHQTKGDVSPIHWQDYQNFLQRLDQAVSTQKQKVLTEEQNRDAHRWRWMAKRQRMESLERIIDRHRKSEDQALERALQKALDDLPTTNGLFKQT